MGAGRFLPEGLFCGEASGRRTPCEPAEGRNKWKIKKLEGGRGAEYEERVRLVHTLSFSDKF